MPSLIENDWQMIAGLYSAYLTVDQSQLYSLIYKIVCILSLSCANRARADYVEKKMKKNNIENRRGKNKVKIIAGRLRGRIIEFESGPNLRPTGNRLREQLFNWLSTFIQGAVCADLFAGSGALSFEALSRGASHCLSIEKSTNAANWLRHNAQKMQENRIKIANSDSCCLVKQRPPFPFDIIFIDPPFSANYIGDLCIDLEVNGWLKPIGFIYIEAPIKRVFFQGPTNWDLWRQNVSGKVESRLYKRIETCK